MTADPTTLAVNFRTYGDVAFACTPPSGDGGIGIFAKSDGVWHGPYTPDTICGAALVQHIYATYDIAKWKTTEYLRLVGYPGVSTPASSQTRDGH